MNVEEELEEDNEDLHKSLALITRNLAHVIKKVNLKLGKGYSQQKFGGLAQRESSSNNGRDTSEKQRNRTFNNVRRNPSEECAHDSNNQRDNIQCRECKGFGHIQS